MQSSCLTLLGLTGILGLVLAAILFHLQDPREPVYIHGTVPYLSHALGMLREKGHYYLKMSKRTNAPIFTLALPGTKLYVVSSPQLVMSVQKLGQELAFPPIAAKFIAAVSGCGKETQAIFTDNMMGEHGDRGYSLAVYRTIREATMPGPKLNGAIRPMIKRVSLACDALATQCPTRINLADWLRHEVMMATASAMWGPEHPFRDPKIEAAFWEFESGISAFLLGPLPSRLAGAPFKARRLCQDAFLDYFTHRRHEQGSELVRVRHATSVAHGVPVRDIARFEVLNVIATVVNTFPAVFWAIYDIHSRPHVLMERRGEVGAAVRREPLEGGGGSRLSLDVAGIKAACPAFVSTLQETLRHRSVGGSHRVVMRDVALDGRYLLREGAAIAMPSLIYHSDPANWGADVGGFEHRRFVGASRARRVAFRTFGGGHTLCPGRHFAMTEMIAVTAMFLMRFDLTPVGGGGEWPPVRAERTKLWAQLTEVEPLLDVRVSVRECWDERDQWVFGLSDEDGTFRMTVEDK